MHHIADIESVGETTRVDDDQPAVAVDVDGPPVDPSVGNLYVDAPSDGRQRGPVPGADVLGERVERVSSAASNSRGAGSGRGNRAVQ